MTNRIKQRRTNPGLQLEGICVTCFVLRGRPKTSAVGGFVQCGQAGRGSSHADVRTYWCKKTSDFLKFIMCPHGQGGVVEPVRTREVNFSQTPFMDGPNHFYASAQQRHKVKNTYFNLSVN